MANIQFLPSLDLLNWAGSLCFVFRWTFSFRALRWCICVSTPKKCTFSFCWLFELMDDRYKSTKFRKRTFLLLFLSLFSFATSSLLSSLFLFFPTGVFRDQEPVGSGRPCLHCNAHLSHHRCLSRILHCIRSNARKTRWITTHKQTKSAILGSFCLF